MWPGGVHNVWLGGTHDSSVWLGRLHDSVV